MEEVIASEQVIQNYADRVITKWRESVESIIATGTILNEARENLTPTEFQEMVDLLPISLSTITKLLTISENEVLTNNVEYLPPHWTTLYELSTMDEKFLQKSIKDGGIHSNMTAYDLTQLKLSPVVKKQSTISPNKALGKIELPENFDLDLVPDLEKDLDNLQKKYGFTFSYDTTKKGMVSVRRKMLSQKMEKLIEKQQKKYNKKKLTEDDKQTLEDAIAQVKRTLTYHPNSDGTFHTNDIRNPNHPYHDWTLEEIYQFIRENMVLTRHSRVRELDKEGFVYQLIKQHCDGDRESRKSAKRQLSLLISKGNEESKKFAEWGMSQLVETL